MQKNGAGLHTAHSAHWDISNDNVIVLRWPSDKKKDPNARCMCIVSIFGLAF
jgi:hypothetical protein